MLNGIWVLAILGAVLLAAATGRMQELGDALVRDARAAVEIALGLVGVMAFFLGLMRVAEEAGLMRSLARVLGPLLRRLFPGVPANHPAMSAMVLNISSNLLGLGNAATPFGLKAMEQLDRLNARKGTATNAMVTFLAINTSGLAILPTTVIGVRAALGSQDAAAIVVPTWIASGCATLAGVLVALVLARLPRYRASEPPALDDADAAAIEAPPPPGRASLPARLAAAGFALAFLVLGARALWREPAGFSHWVLPGLVCGLVLWGWLRGVKVYAAVVEGAKEGFQVALRVIPYLVAILVAVGMLRASGAIGALAAALQPLTGAFGMPAEVLPQALLRPLSGSGALGVMSELLREHGPDSFIGLLASTVQGCTETTFYVLALYCGAIGVRDTRHALPACIAADLAGILAAVAAAHLLFG